MLRHARTAALRCRGCRPRSDSALTAEAEAELNARRKQVVKGYLDAQLGVERASLVRILGSHGAVCKGGAEQAHALMDALLAWKAAGPAPESSTGRESSA